MSFPDRDDDACALCGDSDPLNAGACPRCLDVASPDQRVVLIRPPRDPERRRDVAHRLEAVFGRNLSRGELNDVAAGIRALLRVPAAGTKAALIQLAALDLPVFSVGARSGIAPLPVPFHLLTASVIGFGMTAGFIVRPSMVWLSPLVAAFLFVAAQSHVRQPMFRRRPRRTGLTAPARRAVARALAELPEGRARDTLITLTAVTRELSTTTDWPSVSDEIEDLLLQTTVATQELSDLDDHIARFSTESLPGDRRDIVRRCTTARDHLLEQLGAAVTLLGRARSSQMLSNTSLGEEVLALARRIESETERYADAASDVRGFLDR